MIARLWRGRAADAAKADAYVRHFTGTVTAELKGLAGHRGAWLLRREVGRRHGAHRRSHSGNRGSRSRPSPAPTSPSRSSSRRLAPCCRRSTTSPATTRSPTPASSQCRRSAAVRLGTGDPWRQSRVRRRDPFSRGRAPTPMISSCRRAGVSNSATPPTRVSSPPPRRMSSPASRPVMPPRPLSSGASPSVCRRRHRGNRPREAVDRHAHGVAGEDVVAGPYQGIVATTGPIQSLEFRRLEVEDASP